MLFNSVEFLIFLPIVYSLYRILPFRQQNWMLLLASYLFYGWWDIRFLFLMMLSTSLDFWSGLIIQRGRLRPMDIVVPFVFLSTVFFTLGAAFSHYIAFPWTMQFFASYESDYMLFIPTISPVFAMYVKMMLAMGLVFEMPTAVFFLARIGLVTAGFLLRQFKYAILIIFIAAAILTPGTDVVSQAMMAGPMIVLYILSILIAWAVGKKKPEPDA